MEAKELKERMQESLREVPQEKRLRLCQVLIPYVSDREMQEIQEKLGSPSDYDKSEFIDMTDWVRNRTPLELLQQQPRALPER